MDEYHARYEDVFKEKRDKTPMLQTHDNQIFYQDLKKKVKDSPLQVNGVCFCNNDKIIWWLVAGQMQKNMSIQGVQKIFISEKDALHCSLFIFFEYPVTLTSI